MLLWLTCTHGRYRCLQRNLQCYLDQVCDIPSVMFICNSGFPLKLPDNLVIPNGKHIYIDNSGLMNFQSVGEKYNHALQLAMRIYPEVSLVTSADDDDYFLPHHLQEGYWGYIQGNLLTGSKAYKPKQSFYRYKDTDGETKVILAENTLEPSIFVNAQWVMEKGYAPVSVRYHQQWLDPLIAENKLFIDPQGEPTLIYNWGDNGGPDSWNIYKMSGSGDDSKINFNSHRDSSVDMGNGILYPSGDNSHYYEQTKQVRKS